MNPFQLASDVSTSSQDQNDQNNQTRQNDVGNDAVSAGGTTTTVAPATNSQTEVAAPLLMWGDGPEQDETRGGGPAGGATTPDVLPQGQTFDGCVDLPLLETLMVPEVERTQTPTQAATDAAHAEVVVSADPLQQQTEELQASVMSDVNVAAENARAEVDRLETASQDGGVVAIDGMDGTRTYYEVTEDADGREITHRVKVDPITGETTTETLIHDPNNPDAPYTYQMESVSINGEDARLERKESTFEVNPGALSLNPDGDSGFNPTQGAMTAASIVEQADANGASVETQSIQYNEYGDVVGGNASSLAVRQDTIDNIGAPGDTAGVFAPNQDVYSVDAVNSTLGPGGTTVRTSEIGQGQTIVSSLNTGDGTPTSIIVQKQTDDSTRITQQFVEGSPQSTVTRTTVNGDEVTERTEVWNKPEGYPAEMIGTSDVTRIYGDDGKLAQQDERTVDLKTGELTESRTTREVDGDEVVYNTSTYHEARGEDSTVTYGRQTAELGPDGSESVRSTQLSTPDGSNLSISSEPGQATTATLTDKDGNTVAGSVEAGPDGGTVLTLRDDSTQPPTTQEININADGSLVEDAALSDEEKALVPTLLSIGASGASAASSGLGTLAGLRDPEQLAMFPQTLERLGIDPKGFNGLQIGADGLGLLSGIFSIGSAITELNTPGNNNVRTMFDLAGSTADAGSSLTALGVDVGTALGGSELAAVKMLGKASTFLGGVSGLIGAGAGLYDFANAKDRYDQADGALDVVTGVGGVGIAGATLLGATPPGWVVAAIAGLGLLGGAAVDEMRSRYLPPVYQDLLDPSQQETPEYQ